MCKKILPFIRELLEDIFAFCDMIAPVDIDQEDIIYTKPPVHLPPIGKPKRDKEERKGRRKR
jgi:hypothetical protein